jgi:hypothetical protein
MTDNILISFFDILVSDEDRALFKQEQSIDL